MYSKRTAVLLEGDSLALPDTRARSFSLASYALCLSDLAGYLFVPIHQQLLTLAKVYNPPFRFFPPFAASLVPPLKDLPFASNPSVASSSLLLSSSPSDAAPLSYAYPLKALSRAARINLRCLFHRTPQRSWVLRTSTLKLDITVTPPQNPNKLSSNLYNISPCHPGGASSLRTSQRGGVVSREATTVP